MSARRQCTVALPLLVVVERPARLGQDRRSPTTLARTIPCPAISRDEIKEGLVHAMDGLHAGAGRRPLAAGARRLLRHRRRPGQRGASRSSPRQRSSRPPLGAGPDAAARSRADPPRPLPRRSRRRVGADQPPGRGATIARRLVHGRPVAGRAVRELRREARRLRAASRCRCDDRGRHDAPASIPVSRRSWPRLADRTVRPS